MEVRIYHVILHCVQHNNKKRMCSTHLYARFSNDNFEEKRTRGRNKHRQRYKLILGLKKEKFEEVH
jgi:hypothetical protein